MTGTTNVMEISSISAKDMFAFAPRIGSVLKYNNARLLSVGISSIATASLSDRGSHAAWINFDQQLAGWPSSGTANANDAAISGVMTAMSQTGQYKCMPATGTIMLRGRIPRGIRNFNFQDVEVDDTSTEDYDPASVLKIARVYPKGAVPVTHVSLIVEFSGLGAIDSSQTPTPDPAYDELFSVDNVNLGWMKDAFDKLGAKLPFKTGGAISWTKAVFIVALSEDDSTSMFLWQSPSDVEIRGAWKRFFFPSRHEGGKLSSALTELCFHPVSDARLDQDESYYAHADIDDWQFDESEIAEGVYIRALNRLPVTTRTSSEILSTAIANHAINVNVGKSVNMG